MCTKGPFSVLWTIYRTSVSCVLDEEESVGAARERNNDTLICCSKDTMHVLRLTAILHILNFNILKALGLKRGPTPTRIERSSILRAKVLCHASAQQKIVFLLVRIKDKLNENCRKFTLSYY